MSHDLFSIPRPQLFPFQSGIYMLCQGEYIVYVGQSVDVNVRVHTHKDKEFDTVFAFPCEHWDLDRVEHSLIRYCSPVYNKKHLETWQTRGAVRRRLSVKEVWPFVSRERGMAVDADEARRTFAQRHPRHTLAREAA